jgi:NAD+ synthase (glutamine-hydrolysing)
MKIALAQLNYHIGNFESNTNKIVAAIKNAKSQGAEIILFSELAVCGYPPRDFLEFEDFIQRCENAIDEIKLHTAGIAVLVGCPSRNPKIEGKDLFNSAYFIADGEIKKIIHKTLLPTYDVFDENRYFEPNKTFEIVEYKGKKIAVTICEDLWNLGNNNPLYTICPMDELMKFQPEMILNLSASPFDYAHAEDRKRVLKANAEAYKIPIYYCNQVGAQTEIIFDGGSLVINSMGNVVEELKYFEEEIKLVNSELSIVIKGNEISEQEKIDHLPFTIHTKLIHDALVLGIKDYFEKMNFKKAILGLSGGIDSALVLYLAAQALGKENVHSLLLPSEYSTSHSISDAEELCENLGTSYDIVPIKNNYETFLNTLSPYFKDLPFSVAEENLQARTRGVLLMAFSNKFGYILLNTTNKSEAAVGYGTLYGDMCGGLAVLGDVYKTQVFELCKWINREHEIIPNNIITKPPSAELRPNQKDSDSLPEYDLLDKILYQYIEMRQGPKELIEQGFDAALVNRVLKMVNSNEWKRHQSPPILRVSPKAFGVGRRMPIVGKYLS